MGVKPGGNIALLACAGPMGLALSITPLTAAYNRRGWWWSYRRQTSGAGTEAAAGGTGGRKGIELVYVNTKGMSDPVQMCGR